MVVDHSRNGVQHLEPPHQDSKAGAPVKVVHEVHDDSHHGQPKYNQTFKDNTAWLYMVRQPFSLIEQFFDRLKGHHHPHPYDIDQFDSLKPSQQVSRVVFALEKLTAFNHHAFPAKEAALYSPSNVGLLQSAYSNLLFGANIYWFITIFTKRNFSAMNLRNFGLFTLAHVTVLRPLPLEFKERLRYTRAKRMANKYIKARNGDLSEFKKILDPRTPVEHLAHMKLAHI